MKKHSFLLFELIAALSLLVLCLLPLIKNIHSLLSEERKDFEQAEFSRIADLTFYEVMKKIMAKEIVWEDFSKNDRKEYNPWDSVYVKGSKNRTYYKTHIQQNPKAHAKNRIINIDVLINHYEQPFASYKIHAKGP